MQYTTINQKELIHYNNYFQQKFMFFKVVHNKQVHIFNPKDQASFAALISYIRDVFKQLPGKYQLYYVDEENDEITLANENDFKIMQETANKTVKIYIKEVREDFYDQTQKVVLDDEMESLEQKMNEIQLQSKEEIIPDQAPVQVEEPYFEEKKEDLNQSQFSESQISQITEAQIQEKFKQMLPEFVGKVKESLLRESTQKSSIKMEQPKSQTIVHQYVTCDECGQRNIEGVRYKCAVCADFDLCQNCEAISTHDHPFLKIKTPKQAPYKIIAIINDEEQNSFEVNGHKVQVPQFPFVNQLFEAFCGPRQQPRQEGFHIPRANKGTCPYASKWAKKCEKREQKAQEKVQMKSEPEKKVKVEQKPVETKSVVKLPETQPTIVEQVKESVSEKIVEQKDVLLNERQKLMESATYLSDVLDIDYNRCYKFAVRNALLSKEELLEHYFSSPSQL